MSTYDNFSKTFSDSRKNMKWPEIEYFMEFLKIQNRFENPKILDIWCWSWRLLRNFGQLDKKIDYVWVDSSAKMIDEARKEHNEARFLVMDMLEIEKLNEKFDYIFFIASFHHLKTIQERQEVLNQTKDILNKWWLIFMTNWNLYSQENTKKYQEISSEAWDFNIKIWEFFRYYHGFKIEELDDLFKNSGFEIIENRIFDNERNIISILKKL